MIDTHAHLDACAEPDGAVERARAAGVTRIVTIGTGIASCRAALGLAERHDGVFAALGIDPHQAGDPAAGDMEGLASLLAHPKAVAVGETGLDGVRAGTPPAEQRLLFRQQLELAAETGKPVVVHSRAASAETAGELAGFAGAVVLHCFSEPDLLESALDRGYYVSFAGNVTYPSAGELRLAARRVPADRLLIETDSPYLAPQPVRGQRNEPAFATHTLALLAAVREVDETELAAQVDANAEAVFGLPARS